MKRSRSSTPADALALSFPAPQLISVQAISGNNKSHQALQQLRRSELFACVSAWLGLFGEEFGVVEYQPAVRSFHRGNLRIQSLRRVSKTRRDTDFISFPLLLAKQTCD